MHFSLAFRLTSFAKKKRRDNSKQQCSWYSSPAPPPVLSRTIIYYVTSFSHGGEGKHFFVLLDEASKQVERIILQIKLNLKTKPFHHCFQGRTFRGLIQDFLENFKELHENYLPAYETEAGRAAYDKTLASVNENFPHYVRELQGTADGAQVPFHHVSSSYLLCKPPCDPSWLILWYFSLTVTCSNLS